MASETSKRDPNYVTTLMGVDMSTGLLPTKVYVDETTHRLLVNAVISGGSLSGTEYTEGDTDASFSGFILMGQGPGDTATTLKINASGELVVAATATLAKETIPVAGAVDAVAVAIVDTSGNQIASFGGGVQYTEADTDASITGTAVMWEDSANTLRAVSLAKSLPVTITDGAGSIISSFGGGTQYTEGDVDASITGTAMLMEGAGNTLLTVPGTTADGLLVNLGANNDVVVTNAGTFVVQIDGAALTSLQLIDDAIYTDGSGTVTKGVAILGQDGTNPQAIKTDANGELQVDVLTMPTVTIQDGGGSITVDGTVAISGSVAVTNAGTFAVQESGAALTSLQLIDDTVYTDGTGTVTKGIAILGQDGTNPQAIKTDANGELQVDVLTMPTVTIADGGGSITVDGTVAATQSGTWILGANSGVDIGDVTINNGAGASAINIQDGGNSITVDGTVAVSGTVTVDSELPTAAALADNTSNPTVPAVGAFNMVYDGSTWDRLPGTSTDGMLVNLGANNDVTVTGTVTASLAAGTNNIGDVDVLTVNGVAPAFGSGVRGATVQRVTIATDDVVPVSQSGSWTVLPGNTANTTPWLVTDTPATSGGLSKFHLVGAATDNATYVKASAGQVYSITAFNTSASPRYLKFHNTAGTPTAGSGVTDTFLIPGNTSGAGFVINIDKGIAFSTGIGISIVTGIADSNTTAIGASEVVINIYYK